MQCFSKASQNEDDNGELAHEHESDQMSMDNAKKSSIQRQLRKIHLTVIKGPWIALKAWLGRWRQNSSINRGSGVPACQFRR